MRCPTCGFENRDGARFCGECGRPSAPEVLCPGCRRSNPTGRKFCDGCGRRLPPAAGPAGPLAARSPRDYTPPHLAERILTARRALEGERKQVTVLFADVRESMHLAERLDVEEWHRILDRFFHILCEGVHRFEGTINQFTGDGIMALFGAPIAHEDHARRACHAALHLMDALRAYAGELRTRGFDFGVRMGINSGEVVFGPIGDDLRVDYTAQGHAVGLAARAEQIAEPGTIYVTEHAARLVEGFFALRDQGTPPMKGVSVPVRVYRLEGISALRTRLDVSRLRGFSRLVGREDELGRLDAVLGEAMDAGGRVVGVVGDAGVGKSRLCLEFVEACRTKGLGVHEVHCAADGQAVPLLSIRELLRSYLGLAGEERGERARRRVVDRLLILEPAFKEAVPVVLELLGFAEPEAPPPGPDPEASRRRLFRFVRRLVELRSAAEPTVLLLDDVHWIDAASEEFLAELVETVPGTRTLLVTNFRPEYQPGWMGRSHCHRVVLEPLRPEATDELLRELLGTDPSVAGLAALVRERTLGNPFFIEEVVHELVASGSLTGRRGAYRLSALLETLDIPRTVHALLAARIDRLAEREKRVLQAAAVVGKQFPEPLLRRVIACPADDLAGALRVLEAAWLVCETAALPQAQYAFKHPLTQEVAYRSQLGEDRARLHAAVARALEELEADRLGEYAALIAHHWEAAGMRVEAGRWRRRAALRVSRIQLGSSRWRRDG